MPKCKSFNFEQKLFNQKDKKTSMDKYTKYNDKEFLRVAMLKHEETFKEQVHELHRLYQIQRILMGKIDIRKSDAQSHQDAQNLKNSFDLAQKSIPKLDLEPLADRNYRAESGLDQRTAMDVINESEIELTLGPPSFSRMNPKNPDEKPVTSESGPPSLCSTPTGSSDVNKPGSFLILHQKTNLRRSNKLSGGNESDVVRQDPEMKLDHQGRLKQPPWLLQVLSLNMT